MGGSNNIRTKHVSSFPSFFFQSTRLFKYDRDWFFFKKTIITKHLLAHVSFVLFTKKSVPVIFEPPFTLLLLFLRIVFFFFQALNFLVESLGLLDDLFPFSPDPGRRLSSLHLANVLFNVILPSTYCINTIKLCVLKFHY
jgi:hypothetical protein